MALRRLTGQWPAREKIVFNGGMKTLLALVVLASPCFAAVPIPGEKAPDFTMASQDGKNVSLKDFRGKWVVLYFYPKDFTSGCTMEAHSFEKNLKKFAAAKTVVLGVSMDTSDSHKDFCAKEGLNFKLLSDADAKVSEAYGSINEERKHSARNTFLIKPDGTIAKVWLTVDPAGHADEVLRAIAAARKPKKAAK
jgi:peroxiredoxin Q/BCP